MGSIASHLRNNLVAYLALFVALGGTGYAAGSKLLPKNSVGSAQVINSSLLAKDFKKGQLPKGAAGRSGATGAKGATGPAGLEGNRGPTGPATGPAGGDLTGSYPNPKIADRAVGLANLAPIPAVSVTGPIDQVNSCGAQAIATDTDVILFWTGEFFDTAAMHPNNQNCFSPLGTANRLTAPRQGIYQIDLGIKWGVAVQGPDTGAGTERFAGIRTENGGFVATSRVAPVTSGNGTEQNVSKLVLMNQGEYAEAVLRQNSGDSIWVIGGMGYGASRTFFTMRWVGPAS